MIFRLRVIALSCVACFYCPQLADSFTAVPRSGCRHSSIPVFSQTSLSGASRWLADWWESQQPPGVDRRRIEGMIKRSNLRDNFVVVVTGATGGIGSAICSAVLDLGGLVVAVDRDATALEASMERLSDDRVRDRIRGVVADFSDLDSVARAGIEIRDQVAAIDILVNNAGIFYNLKEDGDEVGVSSQGYDPCFQVNFLSHLLLTEILLSKLNPRGGRVVAVTSGLHHGVDGSGLLPSQSSMGQLVPPASRGTDQLERHVSTAYGNSKLALLWYTASLNRRSQEEGKELTALCACPSWAATGIAGEDADASGTLEAMAFRTQPKEKVEIAGPAVSSILNAMFLPTENLDPDLLTSRKMVGNTQVFEVLLGSDPPKEPKAFLNSKLVDKLFRGRAGLVRSIANFIVLPLQPLGHKDLIFSATSYEAGGNIGDQEELIQWSIQAVDDWLVTAMTASEPQDSQNIGSDEPPEVLLI